MGIEVTEWEEKTRVRTDYLQSRFSRICIRRHIQITKLLLVTAGSPGAPHLLNSTESRRALAKRIVKDHRLGDMDCGRPADANQGGDVTVRVFPTVVTIRFRLREEWAKRAAEGLLGVYGGTGDDVLMKQTHLPLRFFDYKTKANRAPATFFKPFSQAPISVTLGCVLHRRGQR